jgi:hypothetical protein
MPDLARNVKRSIFHFYLRLKFLFTQHHDGPIEPKPVDYMKVRRRVRWHLTLYLLDTEQKRYVHHKVE